MTTQPHGLTVWRERAGSGAVPTVTSLRVVLLSGSTYELAPSGAPAAGSFVRNGVGGHVLALGDLTGDSAIVVSGKMLFY